MRKFLDQKFWSQGTPLGSTRALFSRNVLKIFPHINFWAVLRVLKHPLVATFVVVFPFTGFHSRFLCKASLGYTALRQLNIHAASFITATKAHSTL